MQFVDIEKKDGGAYLHRYDLHYIDRTGCPRTYEMVSRDRNIDSLAHLQQHRTDAVVMVLTDAKREHMALNHEFRMELGQRIYGLPSSSRAKHLRRPRAASWARKRGCGWSPSRTCCRRQRAQSASATSARCACSASPRGRSAQNALWLSDRQRHDLY